MNLITFRNRLALLAVAAAVLLSACRSENPAELVRAAREHQARNDHQAAMIELRNALQKEPNNGEARLLLAQSAYVVGDALTAEKEFRKALEFGQPPAVVLPQLGAAMMDSGSLDKFVAEFGERKLDDAQADAEMKALAGQSKLRSGDPAAAAAAFAAALERSPANVRAQLGQAFLVARGGNVDDAIAALERVTTANPASADAWMMLGEFKVAKGDRAGGRAAFERAIAAAPARPHPRLELISLLVDDKDFAGAQAQIAAARAARVSDLRVQYLEALAAFGARDIPKAREAVAKMLKHAPNHVPTLVLAGSIEMLERRFAEAEVHLQRAILVSPEHMGARALLARGYLATGQPARALEVLRPMAEAGTRASPAMRMLLGEAYLANGDLKQAAVYFETASKAPEQRAMARARLGEIAIRTGDLSGGVRELEELIAAENAPLQAEMALVAGYVRQGQTAKALAAAQALVAKKPEDAAAQQLLGSVHLARKDRPAARDAFGKAIALNPLYMPAVASLAKLDLAENKPADARGRFEAVLAKDPKSELALLGLAEVLARAKAPAADIAAVLQRAIAAAPQSATPRLALVNLHLRDGKPREALTVAQEAANSLGRDVRIVDALGRAQLAAGETNQAVDTFSRMAAADPTSTAPLLRLAAVHAQRNDTAKATEALLRAQKIDAADPNVARQLAVVYLKAGKPDEAAKQGRALQVAAPRSDAGYIIEGDVHAAQKQWAPAEKAYRDGLKAAPASDALAVRVYRTLLASNRKADAEAFSRRWLADYPDALPFRIQLAEAAMQARDWKGAVAQYEAVLAKNPENPLALNNAAWAMGQAGDARALAYAERALKAAPDSPNVLDTIGVLTLGRGDANKSVEYLARAVALAPERHDIRLNYAKALAKAGRADDARKELVRLQEVAEDFPGKPEVAALLKQ